MGMSKVGIAATLGALGVLVALAIIRGEGAPRRGRQRPGSTSPSPGVVEETERMKDVVVYGAVRTPDGTPARGATVYLDAYFQPLGEPDNKELVEVSAEVQDEDGRWVPVPDVPLPKHVPFTATTDQEGRFSFRAGPELEEVTQRQRIKLWAVHGSLVAPQTMLRVASASVQVADLVLGPALSPRLRLLTLDGAPVGDAYVEATFSVPDRFGNSVLETLYMCGTRTDVGGLAVLPPVPDRPDWHVWLAVNPNDMPRHLVMDVPPDDLRRPDPREIRISRGFTVRGVVRLPDGSPGAKVTVSARRPYDPDPDAGHATETADDGSFTLRGVPTREATLTFVRRAEPSLPPIPNAGHESRGPSAILKRAVEGGEDSVVDLGVVQLASTLSISGTVLDPAGKPAQLGLVILDGIGSSHHVTPQGRFEIPGVAPGRHSLQVSIYEDGPPRFGMGSELETTVRDVEAGSTDVVVRVTGGGNLIVRFHPVGKPKEPLEVLDPSLLWGPYGGGGWERATEIRLALEPGVRSDLRVEAEGYKPKMLGRVKILADRKTVVDVELEPAK